MFLFLRLFHDPRTVDRSCPGHSRVERQGEGREIGEGEGWQKLFPFYEDAQSGRFCYCPHFTDGEKTQAQGLARSCLTTKL